MASADEYAGWIVANEARRGTPEFATVAQAYQQAKQAGAAPDPSEGGLPFRPFGFDTGLEMPQGVSRYAAGAGKAFMDIYRGARQIAGGGPSGEDVAAQRKLDAPLMDTGAGLAGNITGSIAATLPTLAIPGVNTYTGAAALGAGLGALQPATSGAERLGSALFGAGAGVAGQGAGNLLGRLVRPVQSALGPQEQALAAAAAKEGIPIRTSQATGSKPMAIAESVLENLPFTSGRQIAGKRAQAEAFNRAVLGRAGIAESAATPEVLAAQRAAVGGELGDIAGRNALDFNRGLVGKLADITDDATRHLPPKKAAEIAAQVDQILSQVGKTGEMAGTNYQGWRQPLNALAKKGDEFSSYYGQIKRALDAAFRDQLPGAEGEAFRDLSRKYANLKVITQAMGGPGLDQTIGNIAPAQLAGALSRSVGREGKAIGRGDLNELSRIGRRFVSSNVPDSGTAQRQLIQALMTGGGGSALGAGAAGATGHDPFAGAAYGAAAGGASLVAPKLAQALLDNPALARYMVRQAGSPTAKALMRALQTGGRTAGALAAPLALEAGQ